MKRRVVVILVLLLAGAVVNVGVAWGCTALTGFPGWPRSVKIIDAAQWPRKVPDHWPEQPQMMGGRVFGWSMYRFVAATAEERNGEMWTTAQFWLFIWSVGWPCRALQWEIWIDQVLPENSLRFDGQPQHTWWLSGIVLRSANFGFGARSLGYKRLPIRPVWPGFAFNTLFYAAVLWLLIPGPFALRRLIRRRRGLCPGCGYPVGESDVCSECGRDLPGRTEAMT